MGEAVKVVPGVLTSALAPGADVTGVVWLVVDVFRVV
jgi:hypothetical protein